MPAQGGAITMLTGNLSLVKVEGKYILPEFLPPNAEWLHGPSKQLIDWWMECANAPEKHSRRELRELASPLLNGPGNPRIWEGFYHILQLRSSFSESTDGFEEQLRLEAFARAAIARKENQFDRNRLLAEAANALGMDPQLAETRLFSDLPEEQILLSFKSLSSERLIHAYNIGLVQGILLHSHSLAIEAIQPEPMELRRLIQRVKFHRLLAHFESRPNGRIQITIDGPLSIFGRNHRYGFQLACFFPWILKLEQFELKAKLAWGKRKVAKWLQLDSGQNLEPVDSSPLLSQPIKEDFLALFAKRPNESWELLETHEVLKEGKRFHVPDLSLMEKESQKKLYLEFGHFSKAKSGESSGPSLPTSLPWLLCVQGNPKDLPPDPRLYGYRTFPLWEEIESRAKRILHP